MSVDPASGMLALPLWMAGALAAFVVVVCVVGLSREGLTRGMRILVGVIALCILGMAATLLGDARTAEGRRLEARIMDLNARVLPSSPLACLVGIAGDTVETACERSIFSSPENVASALTFTEAQLALLIEGSASAARDSEAVTRLRQTVETDRYGLVAQVFAARHSCFSEHCSAFSVLREPGRVKIGLKMQKFDNAVRRHARTWPTTAAPVLVQGEEPPPSPVAAAGVGIGAAIGVDFPSAASIPPVSIMDAEPAAAAAAPTAPAAPAAAPATRTEAATPATPETAGGVTPRRTASQTSGAANGNRRAATAAAIQPEAAVRFIPLPPPLNLQGDSGR